MKKNKTLYCASVATLVVSAFLLVLVGYWLFYPYNTMVIKDHQNIKVDKTLYHPGDHIAYTVEYCKNGNIQGKISRSLVNSIRINFTEYTTDATPGCRSVTIKDLVIPDFVDPGIYHIETTAEYQVNPLRVFRDTWRSVDFRIENR